MKSLKYLEKLQLMHQINDTELAKKLGITQPSISNIKAGRRIMDDETCLAIAEALDINPMEIIGAACIDRAEKAGQKSLWENFLMRTAQSVSAVLCLSVFVNLFLTPLPADAANMRVLADDAKHAINYAKSWLIKVLAQMMLNTRVNLSKFTTAVRTNFCAATRQAATS